MGLRVWREHFAPRPDGSDVGARCGLMSAMAQALERRLCEPPGRLPRWVRSALRGGRYAAVVAAVLGWVGMALAQARA